MLLATARSLSRAEVAALDGLTGEGADALWSRVQRRLAGRPRRAGIAAPEAAGTRGPATNKLRATLPQFYCSYCLGRERVGILEL